MADEGTDEAAADTGAQDLPRDSAQLKFMRARRATGAEFSFRPAAGAGLELLLGEDTRSDVLSNLNAKSRKLERSVAALNARLDVETDPEEFHRIAAVLADARVELDACELRYQLIDNGQPFQDPGRAAEDALLSAIGVVNRALANTAAVSALLHAVTDLVAAYKARATG